MIDWPVARQHILAGTCVEQNHSHNKPERKQEEERLGSHSPLPGNALNDLFLQIKTPDDCDRTPQLSRNPGQYVGQDPERPVEQGESLIGRACSQRTRGMGRVIRRGVGGVLRRPKDTISLEMDKASRV